MLCYVTHGNGAPLRYRRRLIGIDANPFLSYIISFVLFLHLDYPEILLGLFRVIITVYGPVQVG